MNRNIFLLSIVVLLSFKVNSFNLFAEEVTWYYAWNNRINSLEVDDNTVMPILLNGTNYRILKISHLNDEVNSIYMEASNVSGEIFQLPIIKDFKGNNILDVMIPLGLSNRVTVKTTFFLLKITGKKPGIGTLSLKFNVGNKSLSINKKVFISNLNYKKELSMNNWAYFDYSFQTKGLKPQMINDLLRHNSNTLVIPPYHFPSITDPKSVERINKLKNYLNETQNKFAHYVLFLGYSEKDNYVLSESWKKNVSEWYKIIVETFNKANIDSRKILIYPYDEPKEASISRLNSLYDFFRGVGITNDFFVTISNPKAISLARKIEYVQVYSGTPKIVNEVNRQKTNRTKVWIYEIPAGSRNHSAKFYYNMGIKAYLYNANGIGVWNYADSKISMSLENVNDFNRGVASWHINASNPVRDYSLIYRHKNMLFSSIRWEALSFGMEEYEWLKLLQKKYGTKYTNLLINQLLSGKMNNRQWNKIKVSIIQEN